MQPLKRPRGRPRSAAPLSRADRIPLLGAMCIPADSFLTPGEREVLQRFCAGLGALPRLPRRVCVFGSRARGDADEHSDLDVAVFFAGGRRAQIEAALSDLALQARRGYTSGEYGIRPKPVALFDGEPGAAALRRNVAREGQTVWKKP